MGRVGLSACMGLGERVLEQDQNLFKISAQFAQVTGKAGQAWHFSPSPSAPALSRVGGLCPAVANGPLSGALHRRMDMLF